MHLEVPIPTPESEYGEFVVVDPSFTDLFSALLLFACSCELFADATDGLEEYNLQINDVKKTIERMWKSLIWEDASLSECSTSTYLAFKYCIENICMILSKYGLLEDALYFWRLGEALKINNLDLDMVVLPLLYGLGQEKKLTLVDSLDLLLYAANAAKLQNEQLDSVDNAEFILTQKLELKYLLMAVRSWNFVNARYNQYKEEWLNLRRIGMLTPDVTSRYELAAAVYQKYAVILSEKAFYIMAHVENEKGIMAILEEDQVLDILRTLEGFMEFDLRRRRQ